MRRSFWLLLRELRRRVPIHSVSIALGVIVLAIPWLRGGISPKDAAELRGAAAVAVAILWGLALALIEGRGFLSGDLREGRLGFDFRLPVAASSIWAARTLAAFASVVAGATLVISIPIRADLGWGIAGATQLVLKTNSELWTRVTGITFVQPPLVFFFCLLTVLLVMNLEGLARASRSAWFLLDLAALIAAVGLAASAVLPFWQGFATRMAVILVLWGTGAVLLALLMASWRQIARGRTEPDRAHRAFSTGFAAVAIGPSLALALWGQWYTRPAVEDLTSRYLRAAPLSKDLVYLEGTADDRGGLIFGFVLEPRTGRSLKLGIQQRNWVGHPVKASLDGSRLVWSEVEQRTLQQRSTALYWMQASDFPSTKRQSPIVWDSWNENLVSWTLSADGTRVASMWKLTSGKSPMLLRVEELETGSLVATVPIDTCNWDRGPVSFIDRSHLLYPCGLHSPGNDVVMAYTLEIDLTTKEVQYLRRIPTRGTPLDAWLARSVGRVFEPPPQLDFSREGPPLGARLRIDEESPIHILPPSPVEPFGSHPISARFLADKSLVILWYLSGHTRSKVYLLAVYGPTGILEYSRPLGRFSAPTIIGELNDDRSIIVSDTNWWSRPPQTTLYAITLDAQEDIQLARDLQAQNPESASIPTTVFRDPEGKLLWLDLETGELEPLLPEARDWFGWLPGSESPASTGTIALEVQRE